MGSPSTEVTMTPRFRFVVLLFALFVLGKDVSPSLSQPDTPIVTRVSVLSDGTQANGPSGAHGISAQGQFVAFLSNANNLTLLPPNFSISQVFLHDRATGETTLVSRSMDGSAEYLPSYEVAVSDNGRTVIFRSIAEDLVSNDANGLEDLFLYDRNTGVITYAIALNGEAPGTYIERFSLSGDGRWVAFSTSARQLVVGDTNNQKDIFVHDIQTGATTRISLTPSGEEANGNSLYPSISADGRYVAFLSYATNLFPNDVNWTPDAFIYDRLTATLRRIPPPPNMIWYGTVSSISISQNGNSVAFTTDLPDQSGLFVYDVQTNLTDSVVLTRAGSPQGNLGAGSIDISADGRFLSFESQRNGLVFDDSNFSFDTFVYDRILEEMTRVSVNAQGEQRSQINLPELMRPLLSADGRFVTFATASSNLVLNDTNFTKDAFVSEWQRLPNYNNLIDNGTFASGTAGWSGWGTPTTNALQYRVVNGMMEFARQPNTSRAVLLYDTHTALTANTGLEVVFRMDNNTAIRQRVRVMIHAGDFSDFQTCTFWLPPNTPLQTYRVQTYAGSDWADTVLSFYPMTAGVGWIQLDDVGVRLDTTLPTDVTRCIDPNSPG
jgi:Tol biopolymer transport system component